MDSNYQDQILRELGISGPGAQVTAEKVANDSLIQNRALQRLLAKEVPQVIADMTPTEKARLVKRTGPPAQAVITVQFSVGRTNISGEWFIQARGTKSLGRDNVILGDQFFTGAPERAAGFKAFGYTVPAEVAAEYVRNYQYVFSDSQQALTYQKLAARTPASDTSHLPGPNYVPRNQK